MVALMWHKPVMQLPSPLCHQHHWCSSMVSWIRDHLVRSSSFWLVWWTLVENRCFQLERALCQIRWPIQSQPNYVSFPWQDSSREAHSLKSNCEGFQPVLNRHLTKCVRRNTLWNLEVICVTDAAISDFSIVQILSFNVKSGCCMQVLVTLDIQTEDLYVQRNVSNQNQSERP